MAESTPSLHAGPSASCEGAGKTPDAFAAGSSGGGAEAGRGLDDNLAELSARAGPEISVANPNQQVLAMDDALEAAPECPICMGFLCEPLTVGCGHTFCRLCLLQSTRLAPSGRDCPLCRSPVDIRNPILQPTNKVLEAEVLAIVPLSTYEAKRAAHQELLKELQHKAKTHLPIFYMPPGTDVGAPVILHFFEPRYKLLIRRAWEGNQLFVFCASQPRPGLRGVIVRVDRAHFLPDGRANIVGQGVRRIHLRKTWVEEDSGGLYYTSVDPDDDQVDQGNEDGSDAQERGNVEPVACTRCGCQVM